MGADAIMIFEPVTTEQVNRLIKAIPGMGAMMIRGWDKIDYDLGRGVMKGNDRCLFTTEGKRIDVLLPSDGGMIVSETKDVDPKYREYKRG